MWRTKVFPPYLQESSPCVWKTRSPIPVCGGWHKSSEAERSTANHAVYKSLVWMAGRNTDEKKRGGGGRMERGALQHKRISSCLKDLSPWQQIPLPPSLHFLAPLPPASLSLLQNSLRLPWATSVMSVAAAHTPVSTPDYTNRARRWGGACSTFSVVLTAHNSLTHKQGRWHTSLCCSA